MSTPFRHDDHKFEWSQQQFTEWAHNLCVRYPQYMVSFVGVGEPPPGEDRASDRAAELGCCSQCAIFVRRDFWARTMLDETDVPFSDNEPGLEVSITAGKAYKLIYSCVVPALRDERTREQRIMDDALYQIGLLRSHYDRYYSYDTGLLHIPLETLFAGIWQDRDYDVTELK